MKKSVIVLLPFGVLGCGGAPPSQLPNGQAALDRMRASYGCVNAIQVDEAKVDAMGRDQRVRTDVMMIGAVPGRFRLDAKTPVAGDVAAVVTSDGTTLAASDLRAGRFTTAPANACAMERLAKLAIPPEVLVTLLVGHAPVLVHSAPPTVRWAGGRYVVTIDGTRDAREEIELDLVAEDWKKPWSEQRLLPSRVHVEQSGVTVYDAELEGRSLAPMALPPPPSALGAVLGSAPAIATGPSCQNGEVPRRLHVSVPSAGEDVLLRLDRVTVNPWLDPDVFRQSSQIGMTKDAVACP